MSVGSWDDVKVSGFEQRPPAFDDFVRVDGDRVRRGLVAHYGVELGSEAAAEAMRVAWERWDEICEMANPAGYLFRVGQSHVRPHLRWRQRRARLVDESGRAQPWVDLHEHDDLIEALDQLSAPQRSAVLLVRAYGYSYSEAAGLLGVTESAINNHLHRGIKRLRTILEKST